MSNKGESVFFIECSADHWIGVAERLKQNDIHVSYWTAWSRIKNDIQRRFQDTIFHDTLFAKMACDHNGEPLVPGEIDDISLDLWVQEAQIVYDMMNRFDHSRDQHFVEKSVLFYEHLAGWRRLLNQMNPSLVVFSTPPHVVYDYILLSLCRRLNIRTLMLEEATVYPPYCLSMLDYTEGSRDLKAASSVRREISQSTRAITNKLRSTYAEAKPEREVVAHKRMQEVVSAGLTAFKQRIEKIKKMDRKMKGVYSNDTKIVNTSSLYKQRGKSLRDSFAAPYANSQYMDQLLEERIQTIENHQFYADHVSSVKDSAAPYVYFPLSGQPERTSNPQAGIFTQQLLVINLISKSLPEGWLLAVREHPNQFHPEFAVNMCRSIEFYKSILRLDNVILLDTHADPFDIIDRCELAATLGGTSALEAAARGKRVLLFGDAWYRDCPGVSRITHASGMRAFFNDYHTEMVSHDDFDAYIESIAFGCFEGMGDVFPDGYSADPDINIVSITSSITGALD